MIYQAMVKVVLLTVFVSTGFVSAWAAELDTARGDRMLAEYFRLETAKLRDRCLADIVSAEDWEVKREGYRHELLDMLGLDPLPKRTDLKATVTGRLERDDFVVENLHFQSRPGLYVTANLYLPKQIDKPAPTILYLCGHGACKEDGISYGNKVSYHHHGSWFARNGYVCLTIDTLQLGEIEGSHHGTYRQGRWWWLNRGYTPAGVEAWNCVRALDYLETREEVDAKRIGATGRSGGGIYSWWITAIDDRIKAVAPVAGITDLENHVVDGRISSHCDCNFMVNRYRWDFPLVAALAAPRPLLLCNSDRDHIFPLDGVMRVHEKIARIYTLLGARDNLGLVVTPGDHKDTQILQVPVLAWFNKHLKGDESIIETAAVKFFTPQELKVFAELPKDELNTRIDETFVPAAPAPRVLESREEWAAMRDGWRKGLLEKCFAGWPAEPPPLDVKEVFSAENGGLRLRAYDYTSQEGVSLRMYCYGAAESAKTREVLVSVHDEADWREFLAMMRAGFQKEFAGETTVKPDPVRLSLLQKEVRQSDGLHVVVVPRGIGPTRWDHRKNADTHIRRRFMLLGQTVDGMRVWDVRRAIQAARTLPEAAGKPIVLSSKGTMAGVALFASLFEPDISMLDVEDLPKDQRQGPIFLNARRVLDMPEAVAMAVERSVVRIADASEAEGDAWRYPREVLNRLDWPANHLNLGRSTCRKAVYRDEKGRSLPYRLFDMRPGKSRKRPLLVFLHGMGERGSDNELQLVHGRPMMERAARQYGAFVLTPQCPADDFWVRWRRGEKSYTLSEEPAEPARLVLNLIEQLKKDHPIDPDRVYIMGLSMGGFGTWDLISRHPERFAAAVPVCGGGDASQARRLARVPIWAFHGKIDRVVPVSRSRDMIEAIRAAGGTPRYTEYPGVGHDSWTPAFDEPELLPWLFSRRSGQVEE